MNHGTVQLTVESHETEPAVPYGWEEVVEASFVNISTTPMIAEWDGDRYPLRLPPGTYRVRYCARDMDQANDVEQNYDAATVDSYLLQFWQAPAGPDRILRRTSRCAGNWHQAHRTVNPPSDVLASEAAEQRAEEDERLRRIFHGREPNARLRAVTQNVGGMADLDLDLTFALSESDDRTHRAVAAWAALRALEVARLLDVPELGPSIAALQRGEPAVAPFNDELSWYEALTTPITVDRVPHLPGRQFAPDQVGPARQWNAIGAVTATAESDSLTAALSAINSAATSLGGELYREFLADLHRTFPQLHTN